MTKVKKAKQKNFDVSGVGAELVAALNSKFDKHLDKAAYILSDPDVASSITDWISTGCDVLDIAISNRPHGGYPMGRIVELMGMEGSGKSLLAAYAVKITQEKGGIAVYIDTEAAVSNDFFHAIGVDTDKLVYVQLEALEDIFEAIEHTVQLTRSKNKDVPITIIVDSIMGSSTKKELAADFDKDGYATDKAIILSKTMRKITNMIARENILLIMTNQLRTRMGVTFGDQWTTSGGKAIGFHSSVRLRLKNIGKIKVMIDGVQQVIGMETKVVVQKNRCGPPHKDITYSIYFDSGIDNYGAWLQLFKKYKLATSGSSWKLPFEYKSIKTGKLVKYTGPVINPTTGVLTKKTPPELKCRANRFGQIMDANPEMREYFYGMLCDRMVVTYKVNEDFGIDDIEIDDNILPEDG